MVWYGIIGNDLCNGFTLRVLQIGGVLRCKYRTVKVSVCACIRVPAISTRFALFHDIALIARECQSLHLMFVLHFTLTWWLDSEVGRCSSIPSLHLNSTLVPLHIRFSLHSMVIDKLHISAPVPLVMEIQY